MPNLTTRYCKYLSKLAIKQYSDTTAPCLSKHQIIVLTSPSLGPLGPLVFWSIYSSNYYVLTSLLLPIVKDCLPRFSRGQNVRF